MSSTTTGQWVRPATPHEAMCHEYVAQGSYVISYILRVATAKALTQENMGRALMALYKKVPTLRVCLKERKDQEGENKEAGLWLKYVDKEAIDFEVLENADVNEEYHNILKFPFPEEGPLWAARLLPWCEETQKEWMKQTCMGKSEDGKDLPFVSHVLLVFHHSITDGHSCLRIVKTLLTLIDQIVAGKEVDEVEQVATIIDPKHELKMMAEVEKTFKADENALNKRVKSYEAMLVDPMLYRKVPLGVDVTPKTVAMQLIVNKDINKKFAASCKSAGITYHCGFSAVIDAAYVKTLQDLGVMEEKYTLASLHCVNLRSYYGNCENAFGNGMGVQDTLCETPANVLENFWPYAQTVHKEFKKQYALKTPFMHEVVEATFGKPTFETLDWDDAKKNGIKKAYTYGTTNMLDVSKMLSNCGENIRLDFYDRITSVFCYSFLWSSVFQTFNGHLMHSLQYNENLMDQNSARKLSDNILHVMKKLSE